MRTNPSWSKPRPKRGGLGSSAELSLRWCWVLAVTVCGLLLALLLFEANSIAESTNTSAKGRVSGSTSPASSLVASQDIARLYFASVRGPKPWTNYLGDQACLPCHADKVTSYHQTAHHRTSSRATKDSIHGSFSPGSNVLETGNSNLTFRMDAKADGFFQTAVLRLSPSEVTQCVRRIDVVIGSGRNAQTFLYWWGDRLFELPVSYWVERDAWMNSPNLELYADGTANFGRGITPRCLECHVTSFDWLNPFPESTPADIQFNRYTNLVTGISCEKCHGPGGEHVARFQSSSPPKSPEDFAIINPARLSRARQMDACALCHAGVGTELRPALSFTAGDVLSQFLKLETPGTNTAVDVHGNQVQLLERSRCFQSSDMTCVTCHDVHVPQRDLKAHASRCLTCHKTESCGMRSELGHAIDDQCVTCHMPQQRTALVESITKGEVFRPRFFNHHIAIYPEVKLPAREK